MLRQLLDQRYQPRATRLAARITQRPVDSTGKGLGYVIAEVGGQTGVRVANPANVPYYPGDYVLVEQRGSAASASYVIVDFESGLRPDSGQIEFTSNTIIGNESYGTGDLLWGNPFQAHFHMDYSEGHINLKDGSTYTGRIDAGTGTFIAGNPSGTRGIFSANGIIFRDATAEYAGLTSDQFWVGPSSSSQRLVYDKATGTLSVTGQITAGSGAIGGWTITSDRLFATNIRLISGNANTARVEAGTGTDANTAGVNSPASDSDIAMWAGATHSNRGSAPFRVTAAGALTATSANITGTINATSGTLGSMTVSGTLDISTNGVLKSGATGYGSGTGWWFDNNSGTPRAYIGSSSQYLKWNGTNLEVAGSITLLNQSSIPISGFANDVGWSGENLFENGNFEAGARNWTYWSVTNNPSAAYEGTRYGTKTGSIETVIGDQKIPINSADAYSLSAMFKTGFSSTYIYAGLAYYNANQQLITRHNCWRKEANWNTTLYEACAQGATVVRIVPPSQDWATLANPVIQFQIQSDYSDLPNLSARPITNINKSNPNYWELVLAFGTASAYSAGTAVGVSQSGNTYAYCLGEAFYPGTSWTRRAAVISGVNNVNTMPTDTQIWYGARYASLVVIVNANQYDTTYVDDVAMYRVSQATLNAAQTATNYFDSTGKLIGTQNPSGSGLFINSQYMGYYSDSTWKAYISNTGLLYLSHDTNKITLDASVPVFRMGDATGYNAGGTGFWVGNDSNIYKLRIGRKPSEGYGYLAWDGTNLNINASNVGGTINQSLDVGTTGHIKGGASSYTSGTGFWLGYDAGAYKFRVGDTSTQYLRFSGTTLSWKGTNTELTEAGAFTAQNATIAGTIYANAGYISGTLGVGTSDPRLILDGENKRIRTSTFTTGQQGFSLDGTTGNAEFNNVLVRGVMRASGFLYNQILATGGTLAISKAVGRLRDSCTTTGQPFTFAVNISDPDGMSHSAAGALWATNDIIRLKDPLTGDVWAKVVSKTDMTTYWQLDCSLQSGSTNLTFYAGLAVINYGQSGQGVLWLSADDTNAPYYSVRTHAGSPWSSITELARMGNLNGNWGYSSATYGIALGQYATNNANLTWDASNGLRIRNYTSTVLQFDNNGAARIEGVLNIGASGGIYQGSGSFSSPTSGLKIYNSNSSGVIEFWKDSSLITKLDYTGAYFYGLEAIRFPFNTPQLDRGFLGIAAPGMIYNARVFQLGYRSQGNGARVEISSYDEGGGGFAFIGLSAPSSGNGTSIVLGNNRNTYIQNYDTAFWQFSDYKIGICTDSPTHALDINANTMRLRSSRTISTANSTGSAGEICWDSNYLYICTATNTWRRVALSSW